MNVCVCGNGLDEKVRSRMRSSPCRCDKPMPGGRTSIKPIRMPRHVPATQYAQRDALGLPRICDIERPRERWV